MRRYELIRLVCVQRRKDLQALLGFAENRRSYSNKADEQRSYQRSLNLLYAGVAGSIFIFGAFKYAHYQYFKKHVLHRETEAKSTVLVGFEIHFPGLPKDKDPFQPPERRDLPVYRISDVEKHKSGRVWTMYRNGVYDITDFIEGHPGGDKILLAAGASVEPYWALYAQHNTVEVMEMLETMRIGSLHPDDMKTMATKPVDNAFINDPQRHPALIANSQTPYNAETPPILLHDNFITPNPLFFVRNHLPVPKTDIKTHRLHVSVDAKLKSKKPELDLSVDELRKRYEPVTITATIQCAGNRRANMSTLKPVKGLTWQFTAISNATWTGVRLRDVLHDCGITRETMPDIQHIHFDGADVDPTGAHYGASIPVDKAFHPDTIIAYEMNGEPIPIDHGFPIRLIAPGIVGARNVKWLTSITASSVESPSHWQQNDYRMFSPSVDWDTAAMTTAPAIQEAPVQSAICVPANGSTVKREEKFVKVNGYAWSGGGKGIIRVDVTPDNGKTWHTAKLQQEPSQDMDHMYAWTLWSVDVPIPNDGKELELKCKATDRNYNTQPDSVKGIWNIRGLLNTSWHEVKVGIVD